MPNVIFSWSKVKRCNDFFLNVLDVLKGRKRYFHIDENASSEQIYALLDDVESAEEDEIDNLMNDSGTEFITEEKIAQAASTKDTSLTTPEAKLNIIPSEIQSKKKEITRFKVSEDIYLGRKQTTEFNLGFGEVVVL